MAKYKPPRSPVRTVGAVAVVAVGAASLLALAGLPAVAGSALIAGAALLSPILTGFGFERRAARARLDDDRHHQQALEQQKALADRNHELSVRARVRKFRIDLYQALSSLQLTATQMTQNQTAFWANYNSAVQRVVGLCLDYVAASTGLDDEIERSTKEACMIWVVRETFDADRAGANAALMAEHCGQLVNYMHDAHPELRHFRDVGDAASELGVKLRGYNSAAPVDGGDSEK